MIGVVALLELHATLAAGLFSGASIYINLVEYPARIQCGTALAQFAPSYKRATLMQASLAATGFLAALGLRTRCRYSMVKARCEACGDAAQ